MSELTQLGRYKINGVLGKGAMGLVYDGLDPTLNRRVAIKTLLPTLPEEVIAEVRERFLREARSAGRLNHPNIVTIYDVGEHDGVAYIAMELLEGRSLAQILRDPEPMPFAQAAELAAQVADALDHAQRFSIVHRDIKPANIMVDSWGRAKLTDFGVARLPSSSMTQTGDALGSPKYMSPEQVLGLAVDPRADLFSLGIVLYEMLVKRNPFQRDTDTVFSLMHRIAGEPHLALAGWGREIPAGLARVVERALAKKPEERYQRAAEMASDLRNYRGLDDSAFQKTVVVKKNDAHSSDLLTDLDKFNENFEREQEERAREEAQEQRRLLREKEEAERRWQLPEDLLASEPPAPKREAPPAQPAQPEANPKRRAVLEHLQKQAASQPAREDPRAAAERPIVKLDAALREAERFLLQIAGEINSVHPATERPYDFLYIGRVPSVSLSDAIVRAGYERAGGREVLGSLKMEYRVAPARPHTVTLHKDDIGRCIRYLKSLETGHQALAERRNDFGQPIKAQVTVTGSLPCEILVRGDYEDFGASIELSGVRRIGRWEADVDAGKLEAAIDDLVRYLLGVDDELEKRLRRAQ